MIFKKTVGKMNARITQESEELWLPILVIGPCSSEINLENGTKDYKYLMNDFQRNYRNERCTYF